MKKLSFLILVCTTLLIAQVRIITSSVPNGGGYGESSNYNTFTTLGNSWSGMMESGDYTMFGGFNYTYTHPDIVGFEELIPYSYELYQNYPNPFNPTTTIKFSLERPEFVNIKVYNILGKVVAEVANGDYLEGVHSINFNGDGLSSGQYFYRISTKRFTKTKKMVLLK